MGILATIYSLFLSSFHFNFDLKPRAETLLLFVARGSAVLVSLWSYICIGKYVFHCQLSKLNRRWHSHNLVTTCVSELATLSKEEMGSEISDHSHIFWSSCQSFAYSCRPAHQILHAGQLHLSLFCFCQRLYPELQTWVLCPPLVGTEWWTVQPPSASHNPYPTHYPSSHDYPTTLPSWLPLPQLTPSSDTTAWPRAPSAPPFTPFKRTKERVQFFIACTKARNEPSTNKRVKFNFLFSAFHNTDAAF